jgi:hypothetical protein
LKKRTKKLLIIESRAGRNSAAPICKSFLLLFFKKEVLPYLCARRLEGAGARSGCFSSTLAL